MRYISFFAGIGGIDLGLDRAGYECAAQIEIDPFCQQVLTKHWPGVPRYGDITKIHGRDLPYADLFAGGFPCQDLSQAGKRTGIEGSRSGLWFEFARIVGEARPRYVLVENVPGLLVYDGMRRVIGELSRLGYVGIWRCLRASEFGASHLRKRVFLVAYSGGEGRREDAGKPFGDEAADGRERRDVCEPDGNHLAGRKGPDLAHSQYQRFSIGSETHHYNGHHAPRHDPDGCDPVVADTNGRQREQRGRPEQDEGNVFGPDGGSEPLDHSASPRWNGRPENSGAARTGESTEQRRELQFEHGCGPLADAWNGFLPFEGRGPQGRDGAGSAGEDDVSDAIEQGLEVGGGDREPPGTPLTHVERIRLPEFAPGPSDPRWPYILTARPDLAPALANSAGINGSGGLSTDDTGNLRGNVSGQRDVGGCGGVPKEDMRAWTGETPSQSPVRQLADGISSDLDRDLEFAMKDRAKRLSRLGNAVVPQVAQWLGERLLEFDKLRS